MKHWMRGVMSLALVMGLASSARAATAVKDDGTYEGEATYINFGAGLDVAFDGQTATVTKGSQTIQWDPADFVIVPSSTTVQALTQSTDPHLFKKSTAAGAFIRWLDNITSPIQKRFRVPADYVSGGSFKLMLGRSGNTSSIPAIDYQVFVDKDSVAYDAAATDQTAVAIGTAIASGSPIEKTLTVTTDLASLVAGDLVTVEFWRDNVNTSTEDLELLHAEFLYNN